MRTVPRRRPEVCPDHPRFSRARTSMLALALALAGCNRTATPDGGASVVGTFVTDPGTGREFIVDPNDGGRAPELGITRVLFGRLVRVFGFDAAGTRVLVHEDYPIAPNDLGDGVDYVLETNPITGDQALVVFRNVDDPAGRAELRQIVQALGESLRVIADTGFVGIGSYTMVPRNAAIVLQFDDLLDAASITDQSIEVLVGIPTALPFENRLLPDPNHGDLADADGDGVLEFHPTRVIIDPTVSEPESFATNPPLPVNTTGFPASIDQLLANIQVRLATRSGGVSTSVLLQNLTRHTLAATGNGSIDFGTVTRDLVRAARAGGSQSVTGDPYNGYLRDESAPRVIASLDLAIDLPPQQSPGDPFEFVLPQVTFTSTFCAQAPRRGDILTQPGLLAEVLTDVGLQANGVANNVGVRLVVLPASWGGDPGRFVTGGAAPAQYLVPFDPVDDVARAVCFLELTPVAAGFPNTPGEGILPNTIYTLRFNEPIDPRSLAVYDTFAVTRRLEPREAIDYVPGSLQRSLDLQEFTFTPELPLAHVQGSAEAYFVRVDTALFAPTDFAGNEVLAGLPPIALTVAPGASSQATGGRVIRFTGPDEEAPEDDDPGDPTPGLVELLPEWNGQHVYDVARQSIRPRPVTRTQLVGDRQVDIVGQMAQQAAGQNLPLNTFGAKTQLLYRFVDLGLPFKIDDRFEANIDRTFLNMDVEGMALAPRTGGVVFESYPRFRMTMGHAAFLPDEVIDPFTQQIVLPQSGLTNTFENNYIDIVADPPTVVHEDFRGYQVIPGDIFQTPGGTNMIPMPMNRDLAAVDKRYYTWRDTLIQARGGVNGGGVYPRRWYQVKSRIIERLDGIIMDRCLLPSETPTGTACENQFNSAGNVQSAGLPLLVEFDCFPSPGAQTQNVFDTSMAHPTQTVPFFRAFSAGGFDPQGNQVFVDPDLELFANGGFNPQGTPPGTSTPGTDNTYYVGAVDFVVRVSRSASLFYPVIDPLSSDGDPLTRDDIRFPNPVFFPASLDPRPEDQPTGTTVELRFRGGAVIDQNHRSRVDGTQMDPYGDFYPDRENAAFNAICDGSFSHDPVRCDNVGNQNDGITFFGGTAWRSDITALNGAQFIQVHLTFTSDVESGLTPSLSALGLSWGQ